MQAVDSNGNFLDYLSFEISYDRCSNIEKGQGGFFSGTEDDTYYDFICPIIEFVDEFLNNPNYYKVITTFDISFQF